MYIDKKIVLSHWKKYIKRLICSDDDVVHLNERYLVGLEPPKTKYATLMIDGDYNTGKSEWFYQKYINNDRFKTVVVVSPRRSLAKLAAKRYGITDYEDAKNKKAKSKILQLSLCINSITKLVNPSESVDVLFLDECNLIMEQIFGDTIDNDYREELLYHFFEVISNAKHVICAQSMLSKASLFMMYESNRQNILKIVNNYRPWEGLPVDLLKNKKGAIQRVFELLEQNKKILCPCNSINVSNTLFFTVQKFFPNKKILLLTSETIHQDKQVQFLKNPNGELNKYHIVVFTSVMDTGVSIHNSDFKNVVGFCATGEQVGTPDVFVQMLFRGRNVKAISLFIEARQYALPEKELECLAQVVMRFDLIAKQIQYYNADKKTIELKLTKATELAAKSQVIRNIGKNSTLLNIYGILHYRMGCKINIAQDTIKQQGKISNAINIGDKLKKDFFRKNVCQTSKITAASAVKIENKSIKTEQEHWKLARFYLESELCLNLECFDQYDILRIFKFWNNGRVLKKIHAFEIGMLNLDQAVQIALYYMRKVGSDDARQDFLIKWIVRNGIMQSLKLIYEDGNLLHPSNFTFTYKKILSDKWCLFAKKNTFAINAADLGAKIYDKIDNLVIGYWVAAMGIKTKRIKCQEKNYLKVDFDKMKWFLDVIKNRKNNNISIYTDILTKKYNLHTTHNIKTLDQLIEINFSKEKNWN